MNHLLSVINNVVQNLVTMLSKKYKIPENELIEDIMDSFKINKKTQQSNKRHCQYIYTKGTKSGQFCKNLTVNIFCSRHSIKDVKVDEVSSNEKQKIILKMNRHLNLWWHPETKLVVKSSLEKNVCIGIFKNDKLEQLNKDEIEVCKQLGFRLDNHSGEGKNLLHEETVNGSDQNNLINKTAKNVEEIIKDMFGLDL